MNNIMNLEQIDAVYKDVLPKNIFVPIASSNEKISHYTERSNTRKEQPHVKRDSYIVLKVRLSVPGTPEQDYNSTSIA